MTFGPQSTHPIKAKIGMVMFMIYFITMQIFSFFLVGSFYVSVKLFFTNYFKQLTDKSSFANNYPALWNFFNDVDEISFSVLFTYAYASLVIFTTLISIASPIDRAIHYFIVIASVLSFFTICSIVGITVFLAETGFYPEEK